VVAGRVIKKTGRCGITRGRSGMLEVFVKVRSRLAVDVLEGKGVSVGGVGNDQGFIVLVLDRRKLGK
jgi:hypothetical protein